MKSNLVCALLFASVAPALGAEGFLDEVDQVLTISAFHDQVRARVSGLLDLEYYNFPQPPPGLIRADGHNLFAPRLSVFLDAKIGPNVYLFVQSRVDTGFDPTDLGEQWRADEYALRITPWKDGRFNLQIGKFPTVVGDWVERHLSWDNPFVNAPLPYETASLVSDLELPLTGNSFRRVPGFDRYEFLPILWGPVYATGMSAAGRIGMFEYAIEVKNEPVSSRPETWDEINFEIPPSICALGCSPTPHGALDFRPRKARTFAPTQGHFRAETSLAITGNFSLARMSVGHADTGKSGRKCSSHALKCRASGMPTFSPTTSKPSIRSRHNSSVRCAGTRNFS